MLTKEQLRELLRRYQQGLCSTDEIRAIEDWYQQLLDKSEWDFQPGDEALIGAKIRDQVDRQLRLHQEPRESQDPRASREAIIKPLPSARRKWVAIAAAACIIALISTGSYWWLNHRLWDARIAANDHRLPANDAPPGGNKALLTLANGATIILDSAANGVLAQQGGTSIQKLSNGKLAYTALEKPIAILYNSLSTPRGGQYQLTLPDGTRVWLNAASSIRYPVAFIEAKREVAITGEVYFEIAANPGKPFIVNVDEKGRVEVLGTHFNVNAYADEGVIKTTLLEGKVRFLAPTGTDAQHLVTLVPGEQGLLEYSGKMAVKKDVNLEDVMAWKNGEILLGEESVEMIMRQISRWYDVDVHYSGPIPSRRFNGMIDRNVPLSSVLSVLNAYGVHSHLEGKLLTISQ